MARARSNSELCLNDLQQSPNPEVSPPPQQPKRGLRVRSANGGTPPRGWKSVRFANESYRMDYDQDEAVSKNGSDIDDFKKDVDSFEVSYD